MSSLELTREDIDSLDSSVEAIVSRDSPETKYFLNMKKKRAARRRNDFHDDAFYANPKRLFYNVDLLDSSIRTNLEGVIPYLVPADSPTTSVSSMEVPTAKKQINWQRASNDKSQRRNPTKETYTPSIPTKKDFCRPITMIWIICILALSLGCFRRQQTRVMTKDFVLSSGVLISSKTRKTLLSVLSYSNRESLTELSPICNSPSKRLLDKECRLKVRKMKQQKRRIHSFSTKKHY